MNIRTYFLVLLILSLSGSISGQENTGIKSVKGTVRDINRQPIHGALILIDSIVTGITTNARGKYKIQVKQEAKIISATSTALGYAEAEIREGGTINLLFPIALKNASDTLTPDRGDSMVDIGFGKKSKKTLSSQVSQTDLQNKKFSSYSDMYELIRCEVPGVRVNGTTIIITGPSTFGEFNEPLIVVDGIAVSQVTDVVPDDVASISLLKGPGASVYGMRGGNGVILITTRRGTDIKEKVNQKP